MYRTASHSSRSRSVHEPPPRSLAHDFDGSATLSTTVVHAVADAAGVDVSVAERSLSAAVDPASLDRLFAPAPGRTPRNGHLGFVVCGCHVTVYADGRFVVVPPHAGVDAARYPASVY